MAPLPYRTPTEQIAPALLLTPLGAAVAQVEEAAGDVLVFLTGQEDIEAAISALQQRARLLPPGTPALLVLPLYAALPPAKQMAALRPAPPGTRKAILATNIAETSLTIDGVVYVVDAGLAKTRAFHAAKGIDSLLALPISQATSRDVCPVSHSVSA